MGGIVDSLFGGSKSSSTSTSSNQAYNALAPTLTSQANTGMTGMNSLADFLGLGGADGNARAGAGLKNYMNSTGFQSLLDTSGKAITGSNAARGLFQSGATGKALNQNAQQLAGQSAQNYLGNLQGLTQLGLGAAGTLAGAGQQSTGTSSGKSSNGIFSSIPIFSDRRLKRSVRRIGSIGGIPVYSYKYLLGRIRHIGVMAQDVAKLRPDALGPRRFGFMTVRYDRLFGEAQ